MLRKQKFAWLVGAGLALLLSVSSQAVAGPTYVFRQMVSAGGVASSPGYWLITASVSSVYGTPGTVGSLSNLSATLTSSGFSSDCPSGDNPLTSGGGSVGSFSPDTAVQNTTFGTNHPWTYSQTTTWCIPANSADIQPFSVVGALNNATFPANFPYEDPNLASVIDYASKTVQAAGKTYTVYADASLVNVLNAPCGNWSWVTSAIVSDGVQPGSGISGLTVPYDEGADSTTAGCDISSLSIYPNN